MTRNLFGVIVFIVGSSLLVAKGEPAQVPFPKIPTTPIPQGNVDPRMPMFLFCAREANDCASSCEMCSAHCAKLLAGGKTEYHATLKLCQDCAAVCAAMARVAAKDGPVSDLLYPTCAEVCKRCAESCEKHAADPMLKQCGSDCRRCEKACREMTKAAPVK
ncbi:MAG: four-helix bundle copper-binding protein [Gemmataceae bacterium]